MRDKVNRIPDRPAVVHEQGFVLWVRFTDCDRGTDAVFSEICALSGYNKNL